MESIREKIFIFSAVIIVIAVFGAAFYFLENYESIYYTQIDNTKVEKKTTSDNMKYEYTLDCYNKKGNKKELRENAYLMLEVKSLGVHSWKEVQYDELPEKVRINYRE